MARLQLLLRTISTLNKSVTLSPNLYNGSVKLYSSKSDDEKIDKDSNKEKSIKKEKSVDKLNLLLQQMVQDDTSNSKMKTLNLARPKNQRETRTEPGTNSVKSETVEKKIVSAIKNVAEEIGGNKKQTEFELLSKLLNHNEDSNTKNISSNLSEIVKGMKIDRETKAPESISRAQQVKQMLDRVNPTQNISDRPRVGRSQRPQVRDARDNIIESESIDLFGSEPLGIFIAKETQNTETTTNLTWNYLYQRDLRLAVTHPPSNHFQQMILWTEQGKVWKFPIDNEQGEVPAMERLQYSFDLIINQLLSLYGMEEEQKIYFTEHIFLDKHLDPWCPSRGPVRHFMELVCVGLSKNPYMSVKDKREHIEWYKKYFEDKRALLEDVGAIPVEKKPKVIKS